jgi:hypothetical protein
MMAIEVARTRKPFIKDHTIGSYTAVALLALTG